jgi:hypothetical protein
MNSHCMNLQIMNLQSKGVNQTSRVNQTYRCENYKNGMKTSHCVKHTPWCETAMEPTGFTPNCGVN